MDNQKKRRGNRQVYYVETVHVYSSESVPALDISKAYSLEELAEKFKGARKSYFPGALQYHCDAYIIMFRKEQDGRSKEAAR